ncbi:hypothetical protein LSTR_LSTR010917 [Laodelphax striatellus]|uniref:Uncharacterized protein n=1 Tax=Laodelphax striatellus TaxID=195883 RepID=A0A482WYH7_LAOST|nr:hypothetical protein LSTR_LSTR010914 [Laodelphax striatellus]RZF38584.1 hypothetical protein LSTR_LSTR010917 [Laodelphax striatellus]
MKRNASNNSRDGAKGKSSRSPIPAAADPQAAINLLPPPPPPGAEKASGGGRTAASKEASKDKPDSR